MLEVAGGAVAAISVAVAAVVVVAAVAASAGAATDRSVVHLPSVSSPSQPTDNRTQK